VGVTSIPDGVSGQRFEKGQTTNLGGSGVRISSGAPLSNKRENFRHRFDGTLRRAPRQDGFRAADADFLVGNADFIQKQPSVGFLALIPLRRRNMADLVLERTLVREGSNWIVTFGEDATKTHATFEVGLPEVLHVPLETYLEKHRPFLLARSGRWTRPAGGALWISKDGSPMTQMAIYDRIRARTKEEFGVAINPHLFPDAAATTLAIADPEHA
jgi:hypothetical protein